jgi:phosphatidylserine/phosphatidylglycerophosphate/cardiolipin synthase-like enzyme
MSVGIAHFGGPDRPHAALRNLLSDRVAAIPIGGSIDWVTYYFRDRRLASDLLAAHERGVDVRITLEGRPRRIDANDQVIRMLEGPLGRKLRVYRSVVDGKPLGKLLRPRLHTKLYCFSHPHPVALIGSFNPSSDDPEEDPELINEIGDHDRGHNSLVEFNRPALVSACLAHARRLHRSSRGPAPGLWNRLAPSANRAIREGGVSVYFWPRVTAHPIKHYLFGLPAGSRIRLAMSHLSGTAAERTLLRLVEQGIELEILTDQTDRRASPPLVAKLREAGARFERVVYDEWIPMHNKFALVESEIGNRVIFGSFNWSRPSQRYNQEIGVIADDPELFSAFAGRWDVLADQVRKHDAHLGQAEHDNHPMTRAETHEEAR